MQTHYVFVDYDNTHLSNVGPISKSSCKIIIKIFLDSHHNVIPLSLARTLQPLGDDAEYIQLDSGRRNAIDFNIAFQLGQLATQHPDEQFSILSSDPALNEIVDGLKEKGINCARFSDMESLFKHIAEPFSATNEASQAGKVVDIKEPRKR